MHDSKLIKELRSLTFKELVKFKDYLHSPYYNVGIKPITLFSLIMSTYVMHSKKKVNSFPKKEVNRIRIFGKLFPNQYRYNDEQLRKVRSDLFLLLRNFLAQQVYEKNNGYKKILLLEFHYKRKLKKSNIQSTEEKNFDKELYLFEKSRYYKQQMSNKTLNWNNEYLSAWNNINASFKTFHGRSAKYLVDNFYQLGKREDLYLYSLAEQSFFKQDYQKTFRILKNIDHTNVYCFLGCQVLLLKCYYEMHDFYKFISLENKIHEYISDNYKRLDSKYMPYLKLLKTLENLVKYNITKNCLDISKQLRKIHTIKRGIKISNSQNFDTGWLLNKVNELHLPILAAIDAEEKEVRKIKNKKSKMRRVTSKYNHILPA